MLLRVFRETPRAGALLGGLVAVNLAAWIWALVVFQQSTALMAICLLAWTYGLRHAVDADHIADIDFVTRIIMKL